MPNGRSGGFVIETADLKRVVQSVSGDAVVGQLTTGSKPQAASAVDVARLLQECPRHRIAVEEQDRVFYIIHISNEPDTIWVVVRSDSPIFLELRSRQAQWMAEHPGWNGWVAF